MSRFDIFAPLAVLALAGCNPGPGVALTNVSPEEVVNQTAAQDVPTLRPGEWETRTEIQSASMSGLPEMTREKAKAAGAQVDDVRSFCLVEEDAKRPLGHILTGIADNKCAYRNYAMAGGKVSFMLSCPIRDGEDQMTLAANGTYSSDLVTLDTEMNVGGPQGVRSKNKVTVRRTGECKK